MKDINVVIIGLYTYFNVPVRILHPVADRIEGVKAHTLFYKNYDSNLFSLPTEKEENFLIDTIKELKPSVVAISLLSPYVLIAKRITDLVKKHTGAVVIWGGVGPTITPEEHIKLTDVICIGEGERAFEELIIAVRDGKDYSNIKNLWINTGSKIIKNPQGPLIQELDLLPFAEYGNENMYFIELNKMTREDPELDHSILYLQSTRGCPYSCSFCVETMYHDIYKGLGKFVRRRSVDSIAAEVNLHLNRPGNRKKRVYFIDEVFGSAPGFIEEFSKRWPNEVGLEFDVLYHPKSLKVKTIEKLASAGVAEINFGIQTGSDKIRNEVFTRPGTNEEIIELTNEISKFDIKIRYDLILDNDFETKETLKECISLIMRLPKPVIFNTFSLQHFPDYPMTKLAVEAGHITEEELDDWPTMMRRTTENWKFIPRWKKRKKTRTKQLQRLNNIIWMMCWNHASDKMINYAVFKKTFFSKILFHYLNVKSVLLWSIWGEGGFLHMASFRLRVISYPIAAIKLILRGDWNQLSDKLINKGMKPFTRYLNSRNVGS
jgi:anaerobic magnesium-protoporphyrin IX monomethyl ester cyclase|tara:strand:+ start:5705 stop:7345 length:1641 start_codon:yes stop_codon:yes gene_type:complete